MNLDETGFIEINKDNCVLDDDEMEKIDDLVSFYLVNRLNFNFKTEKRLKKIFLKINMLNNLAKESQNELR